MRLWDTSAYFDAGGVLQNWEEGENYRMNILFFLTPKSDVALIYEDDTLDEALEKMESYKYAAMPIIMPPGTVCGNHYRGRFALGH